jgi:hypothetical protein
MSHNIVLKYLFDKQNINARQERWLSFLREYGFEIRHIKGNEKKITYALSRHENMVYTIIRGNYEPI